MKNNRLHQGCYNAIKNGEKYMCPICHTQERGNLRIINHPWDCPNHEKQYCQQPPLPKGIVQYAALRKSMRKQSRRRVKQRRTRSRR